LSYGSGHVFNDLCASCWFSYLLVYLQYVLQIPSVFAGIILLIGQVVDALATPLIGIISDHGKCCCAKCQCMYNYGKRKLWHLIGSICIVASFPFMFSGCMGLCDSPASTSYLAILIILVCVFQFGWAAVQITHLAMIPELTPVEAERDELNIIRFAFDIAADILVYTIALFIFVQDMDDAKEMGPENAMDFTTLAASITGVGVFFTLMFHLGVKERPQRMINHGAAKPSLSSQWCGWFSDWQFYRVGVLYTAARLAHNGSIVFVPLYIQETRQSSQLLALVPLAMNIAGLIGSVLVKYLIQCCGKKACYFIASTIGLISCSWLLVDMNLPVQVNVHPGDNSTIPLTLTVTSQSPSALEFYLFSSIMGGAAAMVVVLSLTSTSDLIDDNTETGAFVYGCMSFADKLANGILIASIQGFHSWVCSDTVCTSFYGQVLIYGIGAPFLVVLFCSLIAPKPRQKSLTDKKDPQAYGSFETSEPVVEFVY